MSASQSYRLDTYLANAKIFKVCISVWDNSLIAIFKKNIFRTNYFLSNSIRAVLRALKHPLLFPSILLPIAALGQERAPSHTTATVTYNPLRGIAWFDPVDQKLPGNNHKKKEYNSSQIGA